MTTNIELTDANNGTIGKIKLKEPWTIEFSSISNGYQFDFEECSSEKQYLTELFADLQEEVINRTLRDDEYFQLIHEIEETINSMKDNADIDEVLIHQNVIDEMAKKIADDIDNEIMKKLMNEKQHDQT